MSAPQQGQQMMPGMHVQPGPMTIGCSTVTGGDGKRLVVLHVEHATGATVLPMDKDMARQVGAMLTKEAGGLDVPAPRLVIPQ